MPADGRPTFGSVGRKVPARVQVGSRTDYRCRSSYDYDSYADDSAKVTFSGMASEMEVGRGWGASIKLGSMLGRPTGCHGLPLTASPLSGYTETQYLAFNYDFDFDFVLASWRPPLSRILFRSRTHTFGSVSRLLTMT